MTLSGKVFPDGKVLDVKNEISNECIRFHDKGFDSAMILNKIGT